VQRPRRIEAPDRPRRAERADALPLCRAAADELRERLKDGADPDDPRLSRAAAGVAYYRFLLRQNAPNADVTYFKAGDVTVHRGASPELRGAQIRDELLEPALPLLRDERFVFRAV
jgi:hypothetical protein